MPWNPEQYLKFERERFAPFQDLLKLIKVRPNMSVVDLGCGTGELSRRLAEQLPGSRVLGIDNSAEMLAKARTIDNQDLEFREASLESVEGQWDLVFSNAAIQWVRDHEKLIPHLMDLVSPHGQLVIQVPSNFRHPVLALIPEIAREEPFRSALDGWIWEFPVLSLERYAQLLFKAGVRDMNVYEKVYPHILPDSDALVEWSRGTAMVPYFERLTPELQEKFLERYGVKLRELFPTQPVFYGFRRILFSATLPF